MRLLTALAALSFRFLPARVVCSARRALRFLMLSIVCALVPGAGSANQAYEWIPLEGLPSSQSGRIVTSQSSPGVTSLSDIVSFSFTAPDGATYDKTHLTTFTANFRDDPLPPEIFAGESIPRLCCGEIRVSEDGSVVVSFSDTSNGFWGATFGSGVWALVESSLDTDGDGVADPFDNCPALSNPSQDDADGNGLGDACNDAEDRDGDEWADDRDNCPDLASPNQEDQDGDLLGDVCDPFPLDGDNEQAQCEADLDQALADLDQCLNQPPAFVDADGDGERDQTDHCPGTAPGAAVDTAGCSLTQFCNVIELTSPPRAACNLADWGNDEPVGNPRDCKAAQQCVPR